MKNLIARGEHIFEAFCLVANESKSRDNISIRKICERLGISRQALSKKGYRSVDEILYKMYEFVNLEAEKKLKEFNSKSSESLIVFFTNEILPILYAHRNYFYTIFATTLDNYWMKFIEDTYIPIVRPHLKNRSDFEEIFLARIIVRQALAIVACWLSEEKPEPALDFRKKFIHLMSFPTSDFFKAV